MWRKCENCDEFMESKDEYGHLTCSPECETLWERGQLDHEGEVDELDEALYRG